MKKHPVDGAGARARTLRQNMTEAERRVWQIMRSHQIKGYKLRRQVPIGCYIVDFACHKARLIVLRLWNNEVLANLDGVHETIAAELGRITPTQTLPHQGGELFSDERPS
jgi:very-short-patch-repair endonuclease